MVYTKMKCKIESLYEKIYFSVEISWTGKTRNKSTLPFYPFYYDKHMGVFEYIFCLFVKMVTVVEGDQKASFSIATTPGCRRRRALLLSLNCSTLPLICTAYCWVLSQEVWSTIFWHDLRLNPDLPDHWWTLYPQDQWASLFVM